MPNVQQVLNEEIRRLAKKEVKALVDEIATLKKRVAALEKASKTQQVVCKPEPTENTVAEPAAKGEEKSFSCKAKRIKGIRVKLHLTQAQFAKLMDVSPITVCHWETGKNTPSGKLKAALQSYRSMGKKELAKILAEKEIVPKEKKQK